MWPFLVPASERTRKGILCSPFTFKLRIPFSLENHWLMQFRYDTDIHVKPTYSFTMHELLSIGNEQQLYCQRIYRSVSMALASDMM